MNLLLIDDSPVVRRVFPRILAGISFVRRTETAPSVQVALRRVASLDPDLVLLDLELSDGDPLAALAALGRLPSPPLVVLTVRASTSVARTERALRLGAVDVIHKPPGHLRQDLLAFAPLLVEQLNAIVSRNADSPACRRRAVSPDVPARQQTDSPTPTPGTSTGCTTDDVPAVVAVGGSTGGTDAIRRLLMPLPESFPLPLLIVQHMPTAFTATFARRLDGACRLEVKEAEHGDPVVPGRVLLAPGHSHMTARAAGRRAVVALSGSAPVNGHRPSVDVLFHSVADVFGCRVCALLLSGMGRDGAVGMCRLRRNGALTAAQKPSSCVINGMPQAAVDEGGAVVIADLDEMAALLDSYAAQAGLLRAAP